MLDAIVSFLALASFAAFLAVIGWFVREPDLTAVFIFGIVLAAYDFWRSFRSSRQNGN